jgi:hypothetical protein
MVFLSRRFTAVGIGTLGLAIVLLGGSIGKAESGASWLVKGTKVSALLKPAVKVQEIEKAEPPLRASFTVFGGVEEYTCTKLELTEFALLTNGSSTGKIRFTGCNIFFKGVKLGCPPEVKGELGVIETSQLNALLVLHKLKDGSTDPLVRIEPSEKGKWLAEINISEECTFGNGAIGGVVYLKDHNGALTTEALTHLFEAGPLTHAYYVEETHPATLEGKVVLGLGGEHSNLNWSGLPG